jgi:hypothetical protein
MKKTGDTKIKIIVVPVGSFIPSRKIELVIELSKKAQSCNSSCHNPNKIDFEKQKETLFLRHIGF